MKNYKCYIFDMDLTLLNTIKTGIKAYTKAEKAVGYKFNKKEIVNYFKVSLKESYEFLKEPTGDYKTYRDAFEEETNKTFMKYAKFYKDSFRIIDKLIKNNKKIGIVTNRTTKNVLDILSKAPKIKDKFDFMVTYDKVSNLKPDPEPILKAAELSGYDIKDCIYIGDSLNDYKACLKAKMDFIYIDRYDTKVIDIDYIKSLDEIEI